MVHTFSAVQTERQTQSADRLGGGFLPAHHSILMAHSPVLWADVMRAPFHRRPRLQDMRGRPQDPTAGTPRVGPRGLARLRFCPFHISPLKAAVPPQRRPLSVPHPAWAPSSPSF